MTKNRDLIYKIASEKWEFEAIDKLNYKTFVEEIPQHAPNSNQQLKDKFDNENTYIICLNEHELLGMVAIRGKRPFSLDNKLKNLNSYLPKGRTPCEIRLLSVTKEHRNGQVFGGMARFLAQYGVSQGFDIALISGTVQQSKLYKHLGFIPFGPLVGTNNVAFQPMYITLEIYENSTSKVLNNSTNGLQPPDLLNLLPGPVEIHSEVKRVHSREPISHRGENFMIEFERTKIMLCQLVESKYVEIFVGSGTLSNDVIAGQLSLETKIGLILTNGEFGNRLIDHATRWELKFETITAKWGEAFNYKIIEKTLKNNSSIGWLWFVHCETSTSVLNNLDFLKKICSERKIKLCIDCISSIGTIPIDLHEVYLTSCTSGKALGSYPGLSMVFYNSSIQPAPSKLPRYLDIGFYSANKGVPFTHSSNLLLALQTAIHRFEKRKPYNQIAQTSIWLKKELREIGFSIVGQDSITSPAVITLNLPKEISSEEFGQKLKEAGYHLSYQSGYLIKHNWIQICLMGESCLSREKLIPFLSLLKKLSTLKVKLFA